MNCQNFESVVIDLARSSVMDAATHTDALAHAESCEHCAARLADERALSRGLKQMSLGAKDLSAPARVEDALLAAFRTQKAQSEVAANVVQFAPRTNHFTRWALAVAAMLLIMFALGAYNLLRAPASSDSEKMARGNETSSPQAVASPSALKTPEATIAYSPEQQKIERTPAYREVAMSSPRQRRIGAGMNRPIAIENTAARVDESEAEIATDFIPLMGTENLPPVEGGQIVRLEVPRSALASFGLPVNSERAGERIKADVLMGNDGLARAVRFVR